MARPLHDPQQRFYEQVEGIRAADFQVEVGPPGTEQDRRATPRYLVEPGFVLVREADLPAVRSRLTLRGDEEIKRAPGVARLPTDAKAGQDPDVFHNHLVTITPVNSCPADEPTLPPRSKRDPVELVTPPAYHDAEAGQGVDVLVVDTGLLSEYREFGPISDIVGDLRDQPPPGTITQYYGHGTFIAGVLRNVAPGVNLRVSGALQHAGSLSEFDLGRILLDELPADGPWPAIISLSAGAPTVDDQPLVGLEEFVRKLVDEHPETVLVAAAGNDGEPSQPFWPAALAPRYADSRAIVAVGALREDEAGRACFSNCGEWVSVYAAGERLVNIFATGRYENVHDVTRDCRYHVGYNPLYPGCTCVTAGVQGAAVDFDGYARWSGTSFATPIVAGRIARCMDLDGVKRTSREAAQYLLSRRTHTIRDGADGRPLPVLFEEDRQP
ncbi:S8 family peptidase [Dactylosporangium sp. NPDC051541]|uniref:S8 family peptidase n=1 Tax=Dactylosporangium sp. NPDC051541 TaxID=3363977 RepID=UPI0037ACE87C